MAIMKDVLWKLWQTWTSLHKVSVVVNAKSVHEMYYSKILLVWSTKERMEGIERLVSVINKDLNVWDKILSQFSDHRRHEGDGVLPPSDFSHGTFWHIETLCTVFTVTRQLILKPRLFIQWLYRESIAITEQLAARSKSVFSPVWEISKVLDTLPFSYYSEIASTCDL